MWLIYYARAWISIVCDRKLSQGMMEVNPIRYNLAPPPKTSDNHPESEISVVSTMMSTPSIACYWIWAMDSHFAIEL